MFSKFSHNEKSTYFFAQNLLEIFTIFFIILRICLYGTVKKKQEENVRPGGERNSRIEKKNSHVRKFNFLRKKRSLSYLSLFQHILAFKSTLKDIFHLVMTV